MKQPYELPEPKPIPTKAWMTVPVSDSADYLDRSAPTYEEEDEDDPSSPAVA